MPVCRFPSVALLCHYGGICGRLSPHYSINPLNNSSKSAHSIFITFSRAQPEDEAAAEWQAPSEWQSSIRNDCRARPSGLGPIRLLRKLGIHNFHDQGRLSPSVNGSRSLPCSLLSDSLKSHQGLLKWINWNINCWHFKPYRTCFNDGLHVNVLSLFF